MMAAHYMQLTIILHIMTFTVHYVKVTDFSVLPDVYK